MKKVSTEKFNAITKKGIVLDSCPSCLGMANIRILMPTYGKTGVKVECVRCGRSTKLYPIHDTLMEIGGNERFGAPITMIAIKRGIYEAINEWNNPYKDAPADAYGEETGK